MSDVNDREELFPDRVLGRLIQWTGKSGFIVPSNVQIDHPFFRKQGGRIRVVEADLLEELKGEGSIVSFQVYKDKMSLGAVSVTMADEAEKAILGGDDVEAPQVGGASLPPRRPPAEEVKRPPSLATKGSSSKSFPGFPSRAFPGKGCAVKTEPHEPFREPFTPVSSSPSQPLIAVRPVTRSSSSSGAPSAHAPRTLPPSAPAPAPPPPFPTSAPCTQHATARTTPSGFPRRDGPPGRPKGYGKSHPRPPPPPPARGGVGGSCGDVYGMRQSPPGGYPSQRPSGPRCYQRPMLNYGKVASGGNSVMQTFTPVPLLPMPTAMPKGKKESLADTEPRLINKVRDIVEKGLWRATEIIKDFEDPDGWDQETMVRRIAKYFNKAATQPDLARLKWDQGAKIFTESALGGFSAACSEKEWFFSFDGAPVLAEAMWELTRFVSLPPRPRWRQLEDFVITEYARLVDRVMLERALREKLEEVYGEKNSQTSKIYHAMNKTYEASLEKASQGEMTEVERVELFMKTWIRSGLSKAGQSVGDPWDMLNEVHMINFFELMIVPFGDDHPFSCIPAVLGAGIGRPPRDWPLVTDVVKEVFEKWMIEKEEMSHPKKKRKKNKSAAGADGDAEEGEMEAENPEWGQDHL